MLVTLADAVVIQRKLSAESPFSRCSVDMLGPCSTPNLALKSLVSLYLRYLPSKMCQRWLHFISWECWRHTGPQFPALIPFFTSMTSSTILPFCTFGGSLGHPQWLSYGSRNHCSHLCHLLGTPKGVVWNCQYHSVRWSPHVTLARRWTLSSLDFIEASGVIKHGWKTPALNGGL